MADSDRHTDSPQLHKKLIVLFRFRRPSPLIVGAQAPTAPTLATPMLALRRYTLFGKSVGHFEVEGVESLVTGLLNLVKEKGLFD